LFVVDKEGLKGILTLPVGKRRLAEKIKALREPFEQVKYSQSLGTLRSFDLELAGELYELLLKPAEPYLRRASGILIVPHGPLFYLPFELTVTQLGIRPKPPGVTLGEFETARYALEALPPINYAPSASMLDPRLRRKDQVPRAGGALLAFGNPTGRESSQTPSSVRMRSGDEMGLPPLPFAEQEAREVAGLYGKKATVYIRSGATKERFLTEGPGYPYLLLSTHGIFDEMHPMYSSLVFAPKDGQGEFKLLETHEIFNMRLNAELVTLSACEVGLGRIRDGEGLLGMSRAFIYAGASSLVVSLWAVYDKSTAQLITGFYRGVKEAPGQKAQALRRSKLDVLKTRQKTKSGKREFSYANPFFWAPFVLVRGP
jgi:CHAT domain-containing protein